MSIETLRARLMEAADVARRLPPAASLAARGYWPSYEHTFEDKAGWGTARLAEDREMRARQQPPTAAALSRHDEVVSWIASALSDERQRRIVWAWAMCEASGRSFSARCRREGWVRQTAYRRRDAAAEAILVYLAKNGILLRDPAPEWVLQLTPPNGSPSITLADPPERETQSAAPYPYEKSKALYEAPDTAWAERQWKREAKRRAKLGMDAA